MEQQLNQWREQLKKNESEEETKLPAGLFVSHDHHHHSSSALPLFAPAADEPTCNKQGMGGGRSWFSMGQWQELELQALIFRHIISGSTVPHQLIHLLITNKTFFLSSPPPPYYQYQLPLQNYHSAWMQSWGKGGMDPEPGRCRRTDGKKWRCSKDAVAGHKYCDRHVHRGRNRNRSRKPVESPTHKPTAKPDVMSAEPLTFIGGGSTSFPFSAPSPSFDLLHFNQRSAESITETKSLLGIHKDSSEVDRSDSQTLRYFFDDWPRAIQEPRNTINNASLGTSLSISVPGINPNSDVSLKLSTGIRDEPESGPGEGNGDRERSQLHWGTTWGGNQMGGPLAEALRSSTSTSPPMGVQHQLRAST